MKLERFESWADTHFQVSHILGAKLSSFYPHAVESMNDVMQLAHDWTDEFEELHADTDWDVEDYWILVDIFTEEHIDNLVAEHPGVQTIDQLRKSLNGRAGLVKYSNGFARTSKRVTDNGDGTWDVYHDICGAWEENIPDEKLRDELHWKEGAPIFVEVGG